MKTGPRRGTESVERIDDFNARDSASRHILGIQADHPTLDARGDQRCIPEGDATLNMQHSRTIQRCRGREQQGEEFHKRCQLRPRIDLREAERRKLAR